MEDLIYHFKIIMHGIEVPTGEHYFSTESANGELGFTIVSRGKKSPWRVHVRRPCFWYYQAFPEIVTGGLLADAIANMSSLNVIAGELDC
jgi:NADH-quinone oxidoreductase subunit D